MPRQSRLLPLPLLLALSAAPLAAQAAPVYTVAPVTDLPSAGQPYGLNNAGQVVGYTYNGGYTTAYVSKDGSTTSLHPANSNIDNSQAHGINESGTAVGQVSYHNGPTRAAVFSNGSVQILGTLGGTYSSGNAINASGQVAGISSTASGDQHGFVTRADGSLVDIDTLGGAAGSDANAINDLGVVTGYIGIDAQSDAYRAYIYANGSLQTLGTLGGNYSQGYAINNAGMVAGYAYLAGDEVSHAFLYANGLMLDIGGFGGNDSYATGINEAGSVVGTANNSTYDYRAFLYSDGKFQDLNNLIDSSLGWTLVSAFDINDQGQIAARGCKAGNQCADLLLTLAATDGGGDGPSAVPEPEALTAGLAGLILSGLLRRRRQR
jgi:probable HAF family extracellular repeat protein